MKCYSTVNMHFFITTKISIFLLKYLIWIVLFPSKRPYHRRKITRSQWKSISALLHLVKNLQISLEFSQWFHWGYKFIYKYLLSHKIFGIRDMDPFHFRLPDPFHFLLPEPFHFLLSDPFLVTPVSKKSAIIMEKSDKNHKNFIFLRKDVERTLLGI